MLYPLKFRPILKQTIWGGERLRSKDTTAPQSGIGESWEISGVEDNISIVAEGSLADNDLQDLIEIYMGELVGDKVYDTFGLEFPLLIKYIDAHDKLSIQVHPDDKTAKERHNAYGKTEMWYVADATPGAEIIIGFNKETDLKEYTDKLQNGTLSSILNIEKVKKGDAFYIPAGTVHAIGNGCFIAEIQQTSDVTYRIYDYDRKDKNGQNRELHTELASDVIDFTHHKKRRIDYHTHKNHAEELARCSYFTTDILTFDKEVEKDYFDLDSFVIYMCISGNYSIVYDTDQFVKVKQGETVLIPASLKEIFLIPEKEATILEIYIQ